MLRGKTTAMLAALAMAGSMGLPELPMPKPTRRDIDAKARTKEQDEEALRLADEKRKRKAAKRAMAFQFAQDRAHNEPESGAP